jgi:hypothetical protein
MSRNPMPLLTYGGLRVQRLRSCGLLQKLDSDPGQTTVQKSQPRGGYKRHIQLTVVYGRPSIIDPNQLAMAGLQIHHPNQGAKWKPRMSRRRGKHVVKLAAGRSASLEMWPIPASHANPSPDRFGELCWTYTQWTLETERRHKNQEWPTEADTSCPGEPAHDRGTKRPRHPLSIHSLGAFSSTILPEMTLISL